MRNAFGGLISRLHMAEERISKQKDLLIESQKPNNKTKPRLKFTNNNNNNKTKTEYSKTGFTTKDVKYT